MKYCKTCKYFERGKWYAIHGNETDSEDQLGGNCPLLLNVLKMNNYNLLFQNDICIQESFGCSLHGEKE